ncbi:MAG: 50S ribosomal protein L5 [Candidatus Omnitrophota bacterium]|nr:50S ribosomal protein L5 [Candidatus Omnitrophota bacterium]
MSNAEKGKPRLYDKYRTEVRPKLVDEFSLGNVMRAPRMIKIAVNMGIKEGPQDVKILELLAAELANITGQKPVVTRAKKSIAAFKLRENTPVGLKVTLRGDRMYEFMDRLFNVAMPRIRDFRGFSPKAFDTQGNYSLGLQEQMIFPEIRFDKVKKIQGMDITFVTTTDSKEESKRLLELLGFPFKRIEGK